MTAPSGALLAIAQMAARRAGGMVAANLDRRPEADSLSRKDVKHRLDVEAQAVATEVIRSACANAVILGEESCDAPLPASELLWIIDPIDGTINFFHGLPLWCCSIAAQVNGRMVAGAVYAPELEMMFDAVCDGPARCNGIPIQVSDTACLEHATVNTGMNPSDAGEDAMRFLSAIHTLAQRPRVLGAAALDLCFVAAGRTDAYFESGIFIWDFAAAGLIVERAGGICETLKSYPNGRRAVLATNGRLHEPLRTAFLPLLH